MRSTPPTLTAPALCRLMSESASHYSTLLDGSKPQCVTYVRFVATFSKVTDNSDATLLRLFMRIDANCDGSVSWDEFISFMLCQV